MRNKKPGSTNKFPLSRRNFFKVSATTAAGISVIPMGGCNSGNTPPPMKRTFGNFDFQVSTIGLGGQSSLQWTPADIDPVAIITKAVNLGINYFDTSNYYGPSQLNYHKAFEKLNLIPDKDNYDEKLRKSIWLTSKTHMRWGKPGYPKMKGIRNWTNGGDEVQCAVDDLKRSLSQIFGDGRGNYPEGAYLDMMLIHNLTNMTEVDVLYSGLETPLEQDGNFGALVALRDYRDGTNLTGMNPKNEKRINHIGFSGHASPPVMVEMIQRDEYGILEGMLVAINANDKQKYNMQHNVIPVAVAKGMGIIGMKVFADAAMYHKEARWTQGSDDVFRHVGTPEIPSRPLIEYSLTTPGVHTLIIGIGQINEDPIKCQLVQNLYASQINPNGLTSEERVKIEKMAAGIKEGKTNYFQIDKIGLTPPQDLSVIRENGKLKICWQTAFAGDNPISHYDILIDGKKIGEIKHLPQTLKKNPFVFEAETIDYTEIAVCTVDNGGSIETAKWNESIFRG